MRHFQNYTPSVTLKIKAVYYLHNILQILGVPNYPVYFNKRGLT